MSKLRNQIGTLALVFYGKPALSVPEMWCQVSPDGEGVVSHARRLRGSDPDLCVVSVAHPSLARWHWLALDHTGSGAVAPALSDTGAAQRAAEATEFMKILRRNNGVRPRRRPASPPGAGRPGGHAQPAP